MNVFLKDGKIWINIDPDDAELLRYGISEALKEFTGDEKFPLLGVFQTALENGIEQTLGLPLFPKLDRGN